MQWIRENLFLSCLAGVLLISVGVAYAVRSGQDGAFKTKDMGPRAMLAQRLRILRSGPPVNKDWIDKATQRLEKIKKQRDRIVKDASDWNRRNYSVLQLEFEVSGKKRKLAAFPYKAREYNDYSLTSKFTNTYRKELYGSLAKLDLTAMPTEGEIGEMSDVLAKAIFLKRKPALRRVEYALKSAPKPKDGATTPEDEDEDTPRVKPKGVSDEDWKLATLSETGVRNMAREHATQTLMVKKANAGSMFVSPKTLAMVTDPKLPGAANGPEELAVVFPQEVWRAADAPASKLWLAQLNLWISQDILASIDQTNQASLKRGGKVLTPTVPNSGIKQLVGIQVAEGYLINEVGVDAETGMTQRGTTPEYEIVAYQFSVVMNTAYLPELLRNIMMRGDHTVTDVLIEHLPTGTNNRGYYGTDPVAKVSLAGELLFRSDWTRKIMPIEILEEDLAGLHRPEDAKRLKKETR
ncbi:MAG: hypothetical protein HN350_08270 [Phycisphaerales bacterium]|jgi:hypothetical protein|nr:hypothetical protein [Phycisphaerales bacterium]